MRWKAVADGQGGGQADVKQVIRSDGSDGTMRFLKILRRQNDPDRRNRMYREVSAYRTLKNSGLPKLVDTNVELFDDALSKLYLVTELVSGESLAQRIEACGPLPLADCLTFVIELLKIVEYCHSEDVVHRDIKPDNIMLRDGSIESPVLVDFGLSFNRSEERGSDTMSSVELGNRFLRLPELSPGSPSKRDPRSDVAFCAGILLYAATGQIPAVLTDEEGRLPHQRQAVRSSLDRLCEPKTLGRLMTLFDRAFQVEMARRWQSAAELCKTVVQIAASEGVIESGVDSLRSEIAEYCEGELIQRRGYLAKQLADGISRINETAGQVRGSISSADTPITQSTHQTA